MYAGEGDKKWIQWRDAWFKKSNSTTPTTDDDNDAEKPTTKMNHAGNELDQARKWIREKRGKSDLDHFLRQLFQEQEAITSHQRGTPTTGVAEGDPNADSAAAATSSSSCLLKQIEWHVGLMLELWIIHGDSFLDLAYLHILALQKSRSKNKKQKKKKKKKKGQKSLLEQQQQSNAVSRTEKYTAFVENITGVLSRAAFYLPANVPLGSFLPRHCLTKHVWKKLPNVVSHILDQFEVPNPYKTRKDDDDSSSPTMRVRKKHAAVKSKGAKKKMNTTNLPNKRPRLVAQKRQSFGGSHFHGKIQDISKLLDTTTTTRTTTPGNATRSNRTLTSSNSLLKSKLVTPHTTSTTNTKTSAIQHKGKKNQSNGTTIVKSKKDSIIMNKNRNNNNNRYPNRDDTMAFRKTNKLISASNSDNNKKRRLQQQDQLGNKGDPEILTPVPNKKKRMEETWQERMAFEKTIVETPVPNSRRDDGKTIVAETPCCAALLSLDDTMVVSETPVANTTTSSKNYMKNNPKIIGETPYYDTDKVIGETPIHDGTNDDSSSRTMLSSAAIVVQPVKLFGTLKPRQQLKSKKEKEESSLEKNSQVPSNKGRTTTAVVAAARAYLRRNSYNDDD